MYLSFNDRVVLAKIETTEGVDATPTGAANAILCGNLTVTPLAGSTVDRPVSLPGFGSLGKTHVNRHVMVEFDVEIAGSGAPGTAPLFGPLLRACGFAETVTAATKTEYDPVSSGFEAATIYANEDGILHRLTGGRGSVSFNFTKDGVPSMHFKFLGRWNPATAVALPVADISGFVDPLTMNKLNTPTFTLDGFAAVLESLAMDQNNTLVHRDRPNAEYVAISDRNMQGSISFEAPALGTKDFLAIAAANTRIAGSLVHGTVAGNIVQFDFPAGQLIQPAYANSDGVLMLSAQMTFNRVDGDDEIKVTVK